MTLRLLLLFLLLIIFSGRCHAWGFWAHQRINRLAVFTLPADLLGFYKKHIEYVSTHATDPDLRRHALPEEPARHFIDLDQYGLFPFPQLPRKWNEAVEKFGEDSLRAHGIVPWHVMVDYYRLVDAFKSRDFPRILKISADLGHYIADAHVPLHTTKNYNGQLTGQNGIHALWESRLPELFGNDYDLFTEPAEFLKNPQDHIWKALMESHLALDSVLGFEKQITNNIAPDRKFAFEERNGKTVRTYSTEFCNSYQQMLGSQIESRMKLSIQRIGSFWLTAWINAGQPDMGDSFKGEYPSDSVPVKAPMNDPEDLH